MPILTQKPNKPRFVISLQYREEKEDTEGWTAFGVEHAEGNTLLEALSKFMLIIAAVQKRIDDWESPKDDDIPF